MFKLDKKFIKAFKEFTPEKQIEWVEKQTEKVIKRLPTLREELKMYDDKSDELYTMQGEEIELIKNVYSQKGFGSKQAESFISELKTYGDKDIRSLVKTATTNRIESFLENIKRVGGEKEYIYAKELLDSLTSREKTMFTKSKYFFDNGNLASENFVKFLNENGVTVGIAKLEGFMLSIEKTLDIEDAMYYDEDTNIGLGRPKKK